MWLSSLKFVEIVVPSLFQGVVTLFVLEFSPYYPLKCWIRGKILYGFGFVME
jgi:cellulose synthase/poly-beta-1,6-N-acetylglucosamine synthase-like glycosyltransferase